MTAVEQALRSALAVGDDRVDEASGRAEFAELTAALDGRRVSGTAPMAKLALAAQLAGTERLLSAAFGDAHPDADWEPDPDGGLAEFFDLMALVDAGDGPGEPPDPLARLLAGAFGNADPDAGWEPDLAGAAAGIRSKAGDLDGPVDQRQLVGLVAAGAGPQPMLGPPVLPPPASSAKHGWRHSRRVYTLAAVVLLLAAGVLGVTLSLASHQSPSQPTATQPNPFPVGSLPASSPPPVATAPPPTDGGGPPTDGGGPSAGSGPSTVTVQLPVARVLAAPASLLAVRVGPGFSFPAVSGLRAGQLLSGDACVVTGQAVIGPAGTSSQWLRYAVATQTTAPTASEGFVPVAVLSLLGQLPACG